MTVVVEHFEAYGQCRDSRRIASLETENAELKDKLKNLESVAEVRLANWQKYEKENAELKNQNAELKGMYAHSAREAGTYKQFLELKEKENAELKEQNYKTKVALRNVIDYLGRFCSDYPDCVIEAEQFLKESE